MTSTTEHTEQSTQSNESLFEKYRNIITELVSTNTRRLKEEFFGMRQKAGDYMKNLVEIVRTNANIKNVLRSSRHFSMNYLFSAFGYKYETNLENANFFHFIAQSWIVNVFHNHKSIEENIRKEYSEILREVLDKEVDFSSVLQTLELLTGTIYVNDPAIKLTEIRCTSTFLKHLKEIIAERRKSEIDANLTKNEFDRVIMDMLSRAVNYALNELDQIDEPRSLLLYNTFNEMNREEASLENFVKNVVEKREENKAHEEINKAACDAYYNFAQTTLTDLIYDLDLFNQRSTSLLSKIKVLVSKKSETLQSLVKTVYANFGNAVTNVKQNLRYEKLKEYYLNTFEKMSDISSTSLKAVRTKVDCYKDWVQNNKFIHEALYYPSIFYEKASSYTSSSRVYLYDHVYSPCKNVTVTVTSESYNFVIRNVENAKENSKKMYDSIKENISTKYSNLKENVGHIVKYEAEEQEDWILIKISRKHVNPAYLKSILNVVYEQISYVRFKENVSYLYEKTKEKSIVLKDSVMDKYRKFLTLFEKCDKSCDSEKREDEKNEVEPSEKKNEVEPSEKKNEVEPSEKKNEVEPSNENKEEEKEEDSSIKKTENSEKKVEEKHQDDNTENTSEHTTERREEHNTTTTTTENEIKEDEAPKKKGKNKNKNKKNGNSEHHQEEVANEGN